MNLVLGTAQFGMDYGKFNKRGKISANTVHNILEYAQNSGLEMLDTALAYGSSEALLGNFDASKNFNIVSKCPSLERSSCSAEELTRHFETSLAYLRAEKIYGYLLHRADDLLGENGPEIWRSLCSLRAQNKISRIGVSAYSPDEVLKLLSRYPLSLVQLPANVLTSWLYESDFLEICQNSGVEVHIRSAFLQGFLLADPTKLIGHLARWAPILNEFRQRATDLRFTPLQAALSALLLHKNKCKVVVGVDSKNQLEQIFSAVNRTDIAPGVFSDLVCRDKELMDPRTWPS